MFLGARFDRSRKLIDLLGSFERIVWSLTPQLLPLSIPNFGIIQPFRDFCPNCHPWGWIPTTWHRRFIYNRSAAKRHGSIDANGNTSGQFFCAVPRRAVREFDARGRDAVTAVRIRRRFSSPRPAPAVRRRPSGGHLFRPAASARPFELGGLFTALAHGWLIWGDKSLQGGSLCKAARVACCVAGNSAFYAELVAF